MNLTNEQERIQEAASKIAREELAPRTAAVDRDQAFPVEGLGKLATAGLLALTVDQGGRYERLKTHPCRNRSRRESRWHETVSVRSRWIRRQGQLFRT